MSIPRGARYKTLQKYFSHPSLVIYFFLNPTHKTKTGMQIGGNHLHQLDKASRFIQARLLTHLPSQKRSPILKNEAISRKAGIKCSLACLLLGSPQRSTHSALLIIYKTQELQNPSQSGLL